MYCGVLGVALVGCGDDSNVPPADGSTTDEGSSSSSQGTTSTSSSSTGSSSAASTSPETSETSTGSTGSENSSSGSDSTGETTGGLALCVPEEFSYQRSGGISDPRCRGGDRCYASAVCTVATQTEARPPNDGWSYALSCDGDWTRVNEGADDTESLVGAEVRVFSLHRLDLTGDPFDYRIDSDYADRFGGIDTTTAQLRRGEQLMIASASGESGFGAAPFGITTDERTTCDASSLTIGYDDCVYPRGLHGPGPDDTTVYAINSEARMGANLEFLGSSRGYEWCDRKSYRRYAGAAVLAVELLVED